MTPCRSSRKRLERTGMSALFWWGGLVRAAIARQQSNAEPVEIVRCGGRREGSTGQNPASPRTPPAHTKRRKNRRSGRGEPKQQSAPHTQDPLLVGGGPRHVPAPQP